MLKRHIPDEDETEHALQAAIVKFLKIVLPSTIRVVAVANKPRSATQGMLEKQRGAAKGFPDLILIGNPFFGLMEVKTQRGSLSREQKEWRDWCALMQIPYAVVRDIDDAAAALNGWGVRTR